MGGTGAAATGESIQFSSSSSTSVIIVGSSSSIGTVSSSEMSTTGWDDWGVN
jgi:hypothetical protein